MIRSKLSLRRPLAVIGAALLGLGAATLVASPASAHHPEISGSFCRVEATNDYRFSWTVGNSETAWEAKITKVQPGPAGDIKVDAILPKKGQGFLTGSEVRTARSPQTLVKTLKVEAVWDKGRSKVTESRTVQAVSAGKCVTPPTPTPPPTTPAPEPTTPAPTTPAPEPTTPAPTTPVPTPSPTLPPVEPVVTTEETCDELSITVENPKDALPLTFTATPNQGEPQTVTVNAGESKTVTFPAKEGLEVVLSNEELGESEPITWTQPDECAPGGGGGDLPLTGAAAGGIAAGAVLLLGAGVALFVVARRRRVTFTA